MSIKELDNKAGQIDDKLKTRDSMNLSSKENKRIDSKLAKKKINMMYLKKMVSSEENEIKYKKVYRAANSEKIERIKKYPDDSKIESILTEKNLSKQNIIEILKTIEIDKLCEFLVKKKEFYLKKGLVPYKITSQLNKEQQTRLVSKLNNINLTLKEKKEIIAMLDENVKEKTDVTTFPEELKSAFNIKTSKYKAKIILDLNRNLEEYRGLDDVISIDPEEYTEEQRAKFIKLIEICPNMKIFSTLYNEKEFEKESTTEEYKVAEKWICSLINDLKPEYSNAQKLAIIDNAIGKKLSYSPDFGTEVFDQSDCRAIWKIISSGYGVCNGIAKVEQYILKRVGIESEIVHGLKHAFLKIKNIELPLYDGMIIKGNTILDPTWNMSSHRFGAIPNNFCLSYEQIRKNDVVNGNDFECHKNDEQLSDANIYLDEKSLRKLFASVKLADKEGNFSIKKLIEKSKHIDELYANSAEKNIREQLLLLKQVCPEFATCQNSSAKVLSSILLNNKNLKFNKCVVKRVYKRNDKKKRPILYIYINSNEIGKKFYYASEEKGKFVELPQKEFLEKFECYKSDLKKENGFRPWESENMEKNNDDLSQDSGKIVVEEEQEK